MDDPVTFGFSPCPNDTFSFHALVYGLVDAPGPLRTHIADVEQLNQMALRSSLELTKLSFPALFRCLDSYALLRAGAALGRGVGPLLVAKQGAKIDLERALIAAPGELTTAHMLLGLYLGRAPRAEIMSFEQVMPRVASGEVQAGLVIHEGRFTYERLGLVKLVDLGDWWESQTGLPIPLGCIAARRDLGPEAAQAWEAAISASVGQAFARPGDSRDYVLSHAQEMEPAVIAQHISLYVNDFSRGLGAEGLAAVVRMWELSQEAGLCKAGDKGLTW